MMVTTFESTDMTSYLTSIDAVFLSQVSVLEIFDFKVVRV